MAKNCEVETKPKTFKELMGSAYFWTPVTSMIIGGILGYLYYHFVGCVSGTCAITSSPYLSIIFGSLLGLSFASRPCRSC